MDRKPFAADSGAARLVTSAFLAFAVLGLQTGVWVLLLPELMASAAIGPEALGRILAIAPIAGIVTLIALAHRSDRVEPKQFLLFATVGLGGLFAAFASLPQALILAALLAGAGMVWGIYDSVANMLGGRSENATGRTLLPLMHATFSLSAAIAAVAAGLALYFGASASLIFAAAAAVIIGLGMLAAATAPRIGPEASAPAGSFNPRDYLNIGAAAMVLAATFVIDAAMEGFLSLYLKQAIEGNAAERGAAIGVLFGMGFVGRVIGQAMTQRLGRGTTAATCGVSVVVGLAGIAAVQDPIMALAPAALLGLGLAPLAPLAYSTAAARMPRAIGRASFALTIAGYISFTVSPIAFGWMGEAVSLRAAVLALIGPAFLIVASAWFIGRREASRTH